MIYICIPAYNEEQTVGVVLWKIRQVMAEYPRDYQLLVVDDASTDRTADVLAPYARVLPLTVVRTGSQHGEGAAIEMMLREAVRRSEYPKRDVIVTLQADFTQEPDELVALIKRMEAGADVVVGESEPGPLVSRWAKWARALALRLLGRQRIPEGVRDPFTSYRAYRVAAVKAALAGRDNGRLVHWNGWAGAAELLLATAPHARRIDTVELVERRERLQRPSRLRPWAALRAVWSLAREARPLQVTSPAELDQAMRSIAAVRTSAVAERGGGRAERTQRQERARGTSEERRPREGEGRRRGPGAQSGARGERTERGERSGRTEGTEHGAGGSKPRSPAAEGHPAGRGGSARASHASGGRRHQPPAAEVAAVVGEDAGAVAPAGSERPKRKRSRRRKRSVAANGGGGTPGGSPEPADANGGPTGQAVTEVPAAPIAIAGAGAGESASPATVGDAGAAQAVFPVAASLAMEPDREAPVSGEAPPEEAGVAAGEGRPTARRRRRGRRGGRRRNSGTGAAVEGSLAADGEAGGGPEVDGGGEPGGEPGGQIGIFELVEGERTNET